MQKYFESFIDSTGKPVAGAIVAVTTYPGGAVASIYQTNSTNIPIPNGQVVTNSLGYFEFYAPDGRYTLTITSPTTEPRIIPDVQIEDPADGLPEYASPNGSSLVGFLQAGTGAVARTVQDELRERVSVRQFGALGDGASNDAPAFQAAIDYCQSARKKLHIPDGNYLLLSALIISQPFDISSDKTARMRWPNGAACGVSVDLTGFPVGLCDISLPQLYGPATDSTFSIPGYVPGAYNYNLASRLGNAVRLVGGDRTCLYAHMVVGFESAFKIEPSATRSTNNVNVAVNTIDFCVYGLNVYAGASPALGVTSLSFAANTVWAKRPVHLDAVTGFINSSKFTISGQTFVNEPGGCGIYSAGNRIDTCSFNVNWLYAGYGSDSTVGVPATLECPFIGGDGTSNALTTDGNSPDIGYFKGNFCEASIGSVMGVPGGKGAGSVPVAGDIIRIRDAGAYNTMYVKYSNNVATSPINTSATVGEANFNGGVGGAQYSKYMYLQVTLPALAAGGSSVDHYVYHQCLSPANVKPIAVFDRNGGLINQSILMHARDTAAAENRRITLTFRNIGAAPSSAGSYVFWLEMP